MNFIVLIYIFVLFWIFRYNINIKWLLIGIKLCVFKYFSSFFKYFLRVEGGLIFVVEKIFVLVKYLFIYRMLEIWFWFIEILVSIDIEGVNSYYFFLI